MRRFSFLVAAALIAGCGTPPGRTDVGAFVRAGRSPDERAILHTIAVYRASRDLHAACSLITPGFLRRRFDNLPRECEYFSGQAPRQLPRSATVTTVAGDRARVSVREMSATRSVYALARGVDGVWRIDDIGAPR